LIARDNNDKVQNYNASDKSLKYTSAQQGEQRADPVLMALSSSAVVTYLTPVSVMANAHVREHKLPHGE